LEIGGFVVDTPGIREFGLNGLHRGDLRRFYPEMDNAAEHCRFKDCAHLSEPDCAVRQAVEKGSISRLRYDNYRKICESLPA
jgi:ribosome biogenesis GTPase